MTSLAELEKKLALITGEDVYGTETSTAGAEAIGADEVKSNSSRGKSSTNVDHKDEDKEVNYSTTPKSDIVKNMLKECMREVWKRKTKATPRSI